MDYYYKIGEELAKHQELYAKLDKLCQGMKGYPYPNEELAEKIIQYCCMAGVDCQSLIEIMNTDCKKECNAILLKYTNSKI